jgi:carboxymethylenebutenolidase
MKKILKRLFLGLLIVLGAAVVFLIGLIVVEGWLGPARVEAVTNTRLPNAAGPEVRAYVARPAAPGPHPVVIMIHEFFGINDNLRAKADLLAQAGYVVVAPDTFRGSSTGWIPRAIYQVITTPETQINQDLQAVYEWAIAQPEAQADRVAVMGFCYGGRASLNYSLINPHLAATVIFYGSPVTDTTRLAALSGPVLGIFGGADSSIPLDRVSAFDAALTEAGVTHEITVYPGQPHAFVESVAGIQAGGAQGEAWAQLLKFLEQTLKAAPTVHHTAPALAAPVPLEWEYLWRLAFSHVMPHQ